ncbi:hypothetical protein EC968_009244 [Mortierella alpina]|nr:hypothetical protein EC968_009244 [Mortierella alpina]
MHVESLAAWATLVVHLAGLLVPSSVSERGVRVRIETGLDNTYDRATGTYLTNAGGHVPAVRVNIAGEVMDGELQPSKLRRKFRKPFNQPTVYRGPRSFQIATNNNWEIRSLDIRMNAFRYGVVRGPKITLNDEICLASFVWTPRETRPNYESRRGAITGDLLYFCGYKWYPSGKVYHGYELRCGWLDGDDTFGNSVKGLFLDLDKFGKGFVEAHAREHRDESSFCSDGVRFYPGSLPLSKRFITANSNANDSTATTTLAPILTPRSMYGNRALWSTQVSANELCDSATSYGPSMVNTKEGIFCDMTTKTKVPLCDSSRTEGCMDHSHLQKRDHPALSQNLYAKNVPKDLVSFESYQIEYFTLTDVNGTIIDNGPHI